MHFWIDKRSSYGIGRPGMGGIASYQPRGVHVGGSARSNQYVKSFHPRNRHIDNLRQIPRQHNNSSASSQMHLNQHQVPVHPHEDLRVEMTENIRNNHWLPIQIICAICVMLATTLIVLKLYYDNEMTSLHVLLFILISLILFISTITLFILRIRQSSQILLQRENQNDNFEIVIDQGIVEESPPPPYNVAISKAQYFLTPPPSYEKINVT